MTSNLVLNELYRHGNNVVRFVGFVKGTTDVVLQPVEGCKSMIPYTRLDEEANPECKAGCFPINTRLFMLAFEEYTKSIKHEIISSEIWR